MKQREDQIRQHWEKFKTIAIKVGEIAVESFLKDYREPERAGTPKGHPIGLSLRKRKAAFLMILHPSLSLKEIAKVAGVAEGVLRLWRMEQDFEKAEIEGAQLFGQYVRNTIVREISESWTKILKKRYEEEGEDYPYILVLGEEKKLIILKSDWLKKRELINKILSSTPKPTLTEFDDSGEIPKPGCIQGHIPPYDELSLSLATLIFFYNMRVWKPFLDLVKETKDSGIPEYVALPLFAITAQKMRSRKSFKEWENQPSMKELDKALINKSIDMISDPESYGLDEEGKKKFVRLLKDSVESLFTLL